MVVKRYMNCGGLKLPALGLSTWQITNDEKELETTLHYALELGYRYIDIVTPAHEKIVGNAVKSWISSGKLKRQDLFITTKLPMKGLLPDLVETQVKTSLENLHLDYVDLYLLDMTIPLTASTGHVALWNKMEEQVDAGRVKTIGLSNFTIAQISEILKSARIKPANLQAELHVYLQQRELVEYCYGNNISVTANWPLGSLDNLPNMLKDPVVQHIAKKHQKTSAQVLLRFLMQNDISSIPSTVNARRLKKNMNIFDFVLDVNDMKNLVDLEMGEGARIVKLE